jgi:two-component system, cell cycle response regulator DivK
MSLINLENKRILIVEDDEMSFLYLNQIMMLTKAVIIRETNGIGALEQFRSGNKFDLVLMDIQLPDMDGKQVTRLIRKMNPVVPIIAQTAGKSSAERELAVESGCTELITKPYTLEELFDVIKRTSLSS